jgi:hypothetical protein
LDGFAVICKPCPKYITYRLPVVSYDESWTILSDPKRLPSDQHGIMDRAHVLIWEGIENC